MRVLVTGATGLVGRHVVERLVSAGQQVTALSRHAAQAVWPAGVRPVAMDLLRPAGLTELLRGHDAVVHAAGPVADPAGRAALRAVHVEGTTRLAEAAITAGVRAFVHVSTLAVHEAAARGGPLDERSPLREHFPGWMHYAAAKRDAERVLQRYAHTGALRVCVLRPGIVLGAGDRYTTPCMLAALRRGGPVVVGSGAQHPPCLCAGDLADAVASAVLHPGSEYEVFLLSGREPPTQADLWRWHARAAGLAVPHGRIPVPLAMLVAAVMERAAAGARRTATVRRFDIFALTADVKVDSRKATQVLGWHPQAGYGETILGAVQDANRSHLRPELHPQGGS